MAQYPIARVRAKSFGPFQDVDISLKPGLNVIIGDNATGKSQLLKLLYSCTKAIKDADSLTKKDLSVGIASKLVGTLRPDSLGRLTRRVQGKANAQVDIKFAGISSPIQFRFSSHAKREVSVQSLPTRDLQDEPAYLPPHEVLTLSAGFIGIYDNYETGFDETWRDTIALLLKPALRGSRAKRAKEMLEPISALLQGGTVSESNGRFYLHQPGIGNLEAPLLAEGHRKLAMIVRLISNGVLTEGGYLFWDEPEANLNPASQKAVAKALIYLADAGAQVFVATHSMFLMRELQMSTPGAPVNYIGLNRKATVDEELAAVPVIAEVTDDLDSLEYVAALEAEAEQAGRYLAGRWS